MHAAAEAPVEAGTAPERLSRHAVEQVIDRLLFEVRVCQPLLDDLPDRSIRPAREGVAEEVLVGARRLRRGPSPAPRRDCGGCRGTFVLNAQTECLSDRLGLLADGRGGRGRRVDVGHAQVRALPLDRVEHQLELAYQNSMSRRCGPDLDRRTTCVPRSRSGLIVVDRNRAELDFCLGPDHSGVDEELFCHGVRGPSGGVGSGHSAAITSTVSDAAGDVGQQRRCGCSVDGSVVEGQRQRQQAGSSRMTLGA